MNQLHDIIHWKKQLGLLPINLFSSEQNNKYILLNGGYGDFCIDFESNENPEKYYSYAWSSNTKNFLTIEDDNVKLYNWLKDKEENIKLKLVQENLSKFYDYIVKDSYKSEYDIVTYIIDIYKKIRNSTDECDEGIQAINQLFLLLVAYEEEVEFKDVNLGNWDLPNIVKMNGLEEYLEELRIGISPKSHKLHLDIDLILRHSAGQLFQEAQKEAIFFNKNYNLFGTYDSNYNSKSQRFSSFHYTPSFLARSIVEFSLSQLNLSEISTLRILDPACGSSEFLLEVLKQLKSNTAFSGNIEISGWDSSGSAISISNFLLSYEKREWQERLTINLEKVNNSLTHEWENDYDLILMNPPFLSWELMNRVDREIVSDILNSKTRKKPNIASAFILKATQHLKENGIVGTVMPSSILLSDSYKDFRTEIKDSLSLLLVGKLGNFVFEHALTDVSILIGKKTTSMSNPLLLWTKNEKGIVSDALRDLRKMNYEQLPYVKGKKSHNIYEPEEYPVADSWKINSYKEQELKKQLNKLISIGKLKTIQDIFNVKQGIRTGNKKLTISEETYSKLPEFEQNYFRKVTLNSSIKNGAIVEYDYLWYPYDSSGLLINNEEKLSNVAKEFYKGYLLEIKGELLKRARKDETNWWTLSDHRAWLREKYPKLISKEFGSSGSFAFDKEGELVVARGNGWIPKVPFNNNDHYYFYLSIFNSNFFEELLSIYSKQLAGGKWYDLGKKYTSNIPIPKITKELEETIAYKKLVFTGKQISNGDINYFDIIDEYLKTVIYKC